MAGVNIKQFQRTYPGNYTLNFSKCLSAFNDFKIKNFTNFYLSNNFVFSDVFDFDNKRLKSTVINTHLQYGQEYVKFSLSKSGPYAEANRYYDYLNYGDVSFSSNIEDSGVKMTIIILDNNICQIYHTYEYKKYYLSADINNNLYFVKDTVLNFESGYLLPQNFKYIFSEDEKSIHIFKESEGGNFFITKDGFNLKMFQIYDDNVATYVAKPPFKLDRNIYTYPKTSLNTSFITYQNDNNIDHPKSMFDLSNNFLLNKKYENDISLVDIIPLKNQLLQEDIFSSSDNLLSSVNNKIAVNGLREYTSILQDIKEETSEDLELNYVFYNKSYKISPGTNYFTSPSSMYPFQKLNINDSKFVDSGSFSFDTPQYSDKVYSLSENPQNYEGGQYLLCTWLSGSPTSGSKVWVDRYYYPDRIEKLQALSSRSSYTSTYDDYIEQLIANNSEIKASIDDKKFFDKISDLVFEPNKRYSYERISESGFPSISSNITYCNYPDGNIPVNYFKQINNSNQFTVAFYFKGDESSWTVKSDHNAIESGLKITKTQTQIQITYNLYDPSDQSHLIFDQVENIKILKENFVCVSIDSLKGIGYFFLNNNVVKSFKIPIYQYVRKQLLYGDFFLYNQSKNNLLYYSGVDITGFFVVDQYIDQNLTFILPILNGKMKVDEIHVTLPCGMRNSFDNIEYLQSVCGSSTFKSNNINIILKNLNVSNPNILKGIEDSVKTSIKEFLPINTNIHNINFQNFK